VRRKSSSKASADMAMMGTEAASGLDAELREHAGDQQYVC